MTDELMAGYTSFWGIGTVKSWKRMTAGLANSNYKVETSIGTFLLKICEENRQDKIQHQLEALLQLKEFNFPSAYPYKLSDTSGMKVTEYPLVNEYALREPQPLAILFDFLEGVPGENYVSSVSRIHSLGVVTGKLSVVPAPEPFFKEELHFPPSLLIRPFLSSMGPSSPFYDHPFIAEYIRTRLPTILATVRNVRLPRAITHGDIFLDNCLWDESKDVVSSVLDFEEVCYEPAILDVAMTIMGCCFDKESGELKEDWTKAFLEGYCSVRPLTDLECQLLPSMMDFCIISAAFWRFNQFAVLHPELNMADSYKELLQRAEKGDRSFGGWWQLPSTLSWRADTLQPLQNNIKSFNSTRGAPNAHVETFRDALFAGFAKDGGLLVPANLPRFTLSTLQQLHGQSYQNIVKHLLKAFISHKELSPSEIENAVDLALATFSHPEVVPLVPLAQNAERPSTIHIMEMFHGTTGAFKDLSMSIIGQLMQKLLAKNQEADSIESDKSQPSKPLHKTIVVGTSGDTGSAAIHAVRQCPSIDIIVLYPHGRVSKIQELQMVTEQKAHVFAVEGTSDDLDVPIKNVLSDHAFVSENQLCSINSINLARVAIQSAHFFYAYAKLVPVELIGKQPLVASIPCGACGDLVGALIAREIGLPLQLVASVNENDIVAKTMATGIFQTGDHVIPSTSPSMDIQVPYNWERVVYYASGGDVAAVKRFMETFEKNPKIGAQMPAQWHRLLQTFVSASSVSQEEVAAITKSTYASDQYILDPHTAVGLKGYLNLAAKVNPQKFHPVVVLATATPHKFQESVLPALGLEALPNVPEAFQGLETLPKLAKPMKKGDNWEKILREVIQTITAQHVQH